MKTEILVIGSGPGGSSIAYKCAEAGKKVVVVDSYVVVVAFFKNRFKLFFKIQYQGCLNANRPEYATGLSS